MDVDDILTTSLSLALSAIITAGAGQSQGTTSYSFIAALCGVFANFAMLLVYAIDCRHCCRGERCWRWSVRGLTVLACGLNVAAAVLFYYDAGAGPGARAGSPCLNSTASPHMTLEQWSSDQRDTLLQ